MSAMVNSAAMRIRASRMKAGGKVKDSGCLIEARERDLAALGELRDQRVEKSAGTARIADRA